MQITWNTDVNAPCCPGEIVAGDGRTVLVQTDWDYCATAESFGWSIREVQHCPDCGGSADLAGAGDSLYAYCQDCGYTGQRCDHGGTDGTVDCRDCGAPASQFIEAARSWLDDNDGATADDPGYFQ